MNSLELIDSFSEFKQLKNIDRPTMMKVLEDAGYIQKRGNRWELTARGIRKIGQKALQDIFNKLKRDGFGRHVSPFRGIGGERTDESKAYQFGDPFLLDLEKTLIEDSGHWTQQEKPEAVNAAILGWMDRRFPK